jgi:hypothetical protein
VLDFKLPLDSILDAEAVVTFEETLEEFLREELIISSNGTKYVDINATVVSQKLVPSNETLSNTGSEPFRRLLQEEMSLFISVLITASFASTDNSGAEINFQREITRAVTRNSERFFDELFATEAFEDPDSNLPLKSPINNSNTAAIVSTVAGGVVIGSIALLFFIRRRQEAGSKSNYIAQKCEAQPPFQALTPPLDYAHHDNDDDDISSLGDEMFTAGDKDCSGKLERKGYLPFEICVDGTDQWSLDDAFPLQRTEGQLEVNQSRPTDGDDLEDEDDFKNVDIAKGGDVYGSSTSGPNISRSEHPDENAKRRSAPKSIASMLFSCFADNTLGDEQGEGSVKRSSIASNSRLYEVRAPAGPLGIIIDNSPSGGTFIAEVKPTSPLKHMVAIGDKIVMVDDVDTSKKSAVALGEWIMKKPTRSEQVLIVKAKEDFDSVAGDDMDDMSV